MAAYRRTGEAGPGCSQGRVVRMKRRGGRGPRRGPGGGGEKALKRLKLAVEEFVHATSEGEAPGGCEGRGAPVSFRPGGRKSRKELRKEKRHLRKARRLQRTAGPDQGPSPGGRSRAEEASGPRRDTEERARPAPSRDPSPPKKPQPSLVKAKATAPTAKTRPSAAATAAARKRALLAANEEEDREIRKLERCLGLNKRKKKDGSSSVPLSFARDGLDYILGALESGKNSGLYDSSGEEEEDAGQTLPESDLESDSQDESEEEEEDVEKEKKAQEAEAEAEAQSEDDDEDTEQEQGQEKGKGAQEKRRGKRVRFAEDEKSENSSEDGDITDKSLCGSGEKYIPPHVRRAEETVDFKKKEELERLKKHVKGLLNRLSEPNMASISGQLEELYMAHSRKDMNDTLTSALLGACVTASAMPSRLMMEHVLLVSILHHTVGIEVGAHFLEAVVRKFDAVYQHGSEGKECDNLFTVIAHLYNFHVVQSLLIFDILKKLIGTFTEKDIELILLMLKNVGFSLRKDDALSLKELITEAQTKASGAGSEFQDQTRIRFMLETMLALKNNDMRKIPGYDPEPVEKLRKLQRALVRNASSGSETQLRVSWDSVLNAEQTGRWWIVGSAWSGAPMIDNSHHTHLQKQLAGTMTFQFSIWDKFRDLENLPAMNFSNLVHLVAHLLKTKSLSLSILKVVEFSELDKPRVHFLRKVLSILLVETEVEDLSLIFTRISDNPKLGMLREGLKLFISHFLLKNAQAHRSAHEANMLRERADLATKCLQGKASLRM
ncbi:nucleolar MIF4G domain-containing protein 1 isoform X2 [Nomascus leucogenys]|uniref:nucleolar MIF4G domain-containing protein 1 isoform X2 n=1 Tax=Nomascus leucogenys TaxID=61853 RepID=UPI00122D5C0F|nr:nucleolar MIF4G domain-containing protein 1 isoform X2 [Nomascus leucogenys]